MTDSPAEDGAAVRPVPFISRVRLKNYKSIAECDVSLGPLTILVGPNGSGKSNFLDALAFLARALETTPTQAINERGGLSDVLRRVPEPAESFSMAVTVKVPWEPSAHIPGEASYEFEIGPAEPGSFSSLEVIYEACTLQHDGETSQFYSGRSDVDTDDGLHLPSGTLEPYEADRLSLPSIRGPFSSLEIGLRRMLFYHFDMETLRTPRPSNRNAYLGRHGENLGDVLAALAADERGYQSRIDTYMRAIVPDAVGIEPYSAGGYAAVGLKTGVDGEVFTFGPESISDGTIRAAAVLAALFQPTALDGRRPLVGIEEPEAALHPAAAGALFDALTEASEHVQVLATSQSADLLDRDDLDPSIIRPVTMRDGLTIIGEVDDASREIAEKKLYTLGELMRGNQLTPKPASPDALTPEEA
jgi:predicted ATPase